MILTTGRLLMRELTVDDASFVQTLINEPSFLAHIGDRGVRTVEDARPHSETGPWMRGAGARAIQELAGHQDFVTTQRYMHVSPAAIESAIRLLDRAHPHGSFGDMVETGPEIAKTV